MADTNPYAQFDTSSTPASAPEGNPYAQFSAPKAEPETTPVKLSDMKDPESGTGPMEPKTAPLTSSAKDTGDVPGEIQPDATPTPAPAPAAPPPTPNPQIPLQPYGTYSQPGQPYSTVPTLPQALFKNVGIPINQVKSSTTVGEPEHRLPVGSPLAPQNQAAAQKGVHQITPGMNLGQVAKNVAFNLGNDLDIGKQNVNAVANNLGNRLFNETRPPNAQGTGGLGRSVLPDAQDMQSLLNSTNQGLQQMHDTYGRAAWQDVAGQALGHPGGTWADAGMIGGGAGLKFAGGLAGKTLKGAVSYTDKAIESNLFAKGGGMGRAPRLHVHNPELEAAGYEQRPNAGFGSVGEYRKFKEAAKEKARKLVAGLDFKNIYKHHQVKKMIDKALDAADKQYNAAIGPIFAKLEELGNAIPPAIRHKIMAGAEYTDPKFASEMKNMPKVQAFLKYNDQLWSSLEEYLGLTDDEKLVARYGPIMIAQLKAKMPAMRLTMAHLYDEHGVPLPHVLEGLREIKKRMDARDEHPRYFAIFNKEQLRNALKYHKDAIGTRGLKDVMHLWTQRKGHIYSGIEKAVTNEDIEAILEKGRTSGDPRQEEAVKAIESEHLPYSLRNKGNNTDVVPNVQAAIAHAMKVKAVTDAFQKLVDNPKFPDSYKHGLSAYAQERFGEKLRLNLQNLPPGSLEQALKEFGEQVRMPDAITKYLDDLTGTRGTNAFAKIIGDISTTYKIHLLGTDIWRAAKQFPQACLFAATTALKGPRDVVRFAIATAIAANPKLADEFINTVKGAVELVGDEPGMIKSIREDWTKPGLPNKVMAALMTYPRLVKGSTDFVNRVDDAVRTVTAATLCIQKFETMTGEEVMFWDKGLKLSAKINENLSAIMTDEKMGTQIVNEINTHLGEYARKNKGVKQLIRDWFLWVPWCEHSFKATLAAKASRPVVFMTVKNIGAVIADKAQDKSVLPEDAVRRGAVVAKGQNGQPMTGHGKGNPMVYQSFANYTPWTTGVEITADTVHNVLKALGSGADGQDLIDWENPTGLQPSLLGQLGELAGAYADPKHFTRPADPRVIKDNHGRMWLRSDIARVQLPPTDPNHLDKKDLKEYPEQMPRVDAALGRLVLVRPYIHALEAYEAKEGGVPSAFTALPWGPFPGVHAPKMRHMTADEQKAERTKAEAEGRTLIKSDWMTKVAPSFKPGDEGALFAHGLLKNFEPTELPTTRAQEDKIKKQAQKSVLHKQKYNSKPLEGNPAQSTAPSY